MSEITTSPTEFEDRSFVAQHGTLKKASILLAIMIVVAWYFWGGSPSNSSNQRATMAGGVPEGPGSSEIATSDTPIDTTDDDLRKLIVGSWETDRSGRRELTVNEDGTARMDVTIENTLARMLLGERILLFLDWKIENRELTFVTTGGEPVSKVNLMMTMYGKERAQKIITLDETTLHHPDDDPEGEDHIWKRIAN
ncbi:MAG TPA: hypothetical protein VLA12_11125 [Planctomycetaceae bacterium]|nr:hypothetical protein [Planctomycetaceae bacterium]